MAQISDNDAIFNQIEQLNSEGKYEQILETVAKVSEDKVSNKLWFKKIQALNSLGLFKEARKEIGLVSKRCSEPCEDAMLFYLMGYTFEHSGHEHKAVECYSRTREFDPDFENIQSLIDNCKAAVKKDLEITKETFGKLISEVDAAIKGAKGQKKLEYPEALTYASLISSSFIPTGLGFELPVDNPFFKLKDNDLKEKVKFYLDRKYGVTDVKSLQQWYGNNRLAPTIQGVRNALAKNIQMPVEKMSAKEITYFESIMFSLNSLEEFLPEAGVAAWDYNEVIALSRIAFAADIISNSEFCEATLFFTDECTRNFSSWTEYAHSLIIGGYFNCLFETQYDIKNATMFGTVSCRHCKENYPKVKWIK